MTYNWYDTRASTWYEGYGHDDTSGAAGSFQDLSKLTQGTADYNAALEAVTNNIIGLFEDKGITAEKAQQSQQFQDLIDQAKAGDTKGAFQGAAAAVTSARDRGDLYGADILEGGEQGYGASFLADVASGAATGSVTDLFTKGFLRTEGEMAADTEGLQYWEDKLGTTDASGKTWTIDKIAESFAQSEEANIRQSYHEQYGRDADVDGLGYWMNVSGGMDSTQTDHGAFDASDLVRRSLSERDTKYEQAETTIRDEFRDALGQSSRAEDRHTKFGGTNDSASPYFTAAGAHDVNQYVSAIQGAGADKANALQAAITDINMRMTGRDAISQGDQDDYLAAFDSDGDGQITDADTRTNDPTYMSRFATYDQIRNLQQEFKDAGGTFSIEGMPEDVNLWSKEQRASGHPGMQDFLEFGFKKVMGDKWDALTHERTKTLDDLVGILPHGQLIPEHTVRLLAPENLPGHVEKSDKLKSNWNNWMPAIPGVTGPSKGVVQDGWKPDIPDKPTKPTPLPVDKPDINYIPNVSSDVQDTSGYGAAKTQFDQAVAGTPIARTAQGTAGQRFTGTSAKGVRMKRSKASRMGTIRGTKQLGREQQLKSLNI